VAHRGESGRQCFFGEANVAFVRRHNNPCVGGYPSLRYQVNQVISQSCRRCLKIFPFDFKHLRMIPAPPRDTNATCTGQNPSICEDAEKPVGMDSTEGPMTTLPERTESDMIERVTRKRVSETNEGLADDLLWGVAAIAAEIGRTPRQVYHLIEAGRLPVKKLGNKTIVASRAELRAFLTGGATNDPLHRTNDDHDHSQRPGEA
jgi:hypothetical protein